MKFDPKKFISGFNLFDGEKLGKLLFYAVLFTIFGFIMWSAFIKPSTKDIQTVAQRMDFHGARIDGLVISTDKSTKQEALNWSAGPTVLYNEDDGWSYGFTLLRRF